MCYISLPLLFRMLRTNDQLCIAPNKKKWENGTRHEELQKDYHNQRRYAKRQWFDWKDHNEQEQRVFRDT